MSPGVDFILEFLFLYSDLLDAMVLNPQTCNSLHVQVQRWSLLERDFSLPGGELNNTLKLKRSFVANKYAEQIDLMYNSPDPFAPKKD